MLQLLSCFVTYMRQQDAEFQGLLFPKDFIREPCLQEIYCLYPAQFSEQSSQFSIVQKLQILVQRSIGIPSSLMSPGSTYQLIFAVLSTYLSILSYRENQERAIFSPMSGKLANIAVGSSEQTSCWTVTRTTVQQSLCDWCDVTGSDHFRGAVCTNFFLWT